jgi:hypothetical protein
MLRSTIAHNGIHTKLPLDLKVLQLFTHQLPILLYITDLDGEQTSKLQQIFISLTTFGMISDLLVSQLTTRRTSHSMAMFS